MMLKLNPLGDILAAASAFVWAAYAILMKKSAHSVTIQSNAHSGSFCTVCYSWFPLCSCLISASTQALFLPVNWLNILFLGAGASALCFVTWNWSVGVLGAVKRALISIWCPSSLLRHPLSFCKKTDMGCFCGGALTLAGLYISETKPNRS
ncbi:EamA family transporter [Bacillus licheniformis]|nr:EamA family transporter [Bacillus licheniformis]